MSLAKSTPNLSTPNLLPLLAQNDFTQVLHIVTRRNLRYSLFESQSDYNKWCQSLTTQLLSLLPYDLGTTWTPLDGLTILDPTNHRITQLECIANCLEIINSKREANTVRILVNDLIGTNVHGWVELSKYCELQTCLEESGQCLSRAIRLFDQHSDSHIIQNKIFLATLWDLRASNFHERNQLIAAEAARTVRDQISWE